VSDSEQVNSGAAQQFAVQAVHHTLGQRTDVDSCAALTRRINGLLDEAFQHFQQDGAALACRAGCSFCCHLRVMVYPHEAIALFRYLGSRMPREQTTVVRERVVQNAALIREGRAPAALACAFLVDGKCSAYEVRPGACSGYHSLSRERCEAEYQSAANAPDGVPVLKALRYVAAALDDGMEQGLSALGLSKARIELHIAVAALIKSPALIQRWRSGRELLKSDGGGRYITCG